MSDEKDDKYGHQLEPDDVYEDVEYSDVHRVKPYKPDFVDPKLIATKAEVEQFTRQYLQLQEIYGVRKKTRDSFRNFAERTPWLAGLLGVEHIPEISAQQICDEEEARKMHKMKKVAHLERDLHPSMVLQETARGELWKEPAVRKAEEYGKYIIGKNRALLEKKDYKKWRNVMLDFREKLGGTAERDAFYEVVKMEAERALTAALQDWDETVTEAFMYLGGIELFAPEDLLDVPKKVFEDAQLQSVFIEFMAKLCETHPKLFFKVRDHLMKLGFFKDPEEIDWHPVIVEATNKALESALNFDQAIFMRYRNLYKDQGFSRHSNGIEESKLNEILFQRLRNAAKTSPGKYLAIRKQLERLEIMDGETADSDDEVRWALLGHVLRWKNIHPWALTKLQLYWRTNGLEVMDEITIEEFADHENPKLRSNPHDAVLIPYGVIPNDLETEAVAHRALNYFVHEKERYEEFETDTEKLSTDYLDIDSGKLHEIYKKFPQYHEKNDGKGYLAGLISKK